MKHGAHAIWFEIVTNPTPAWPDAAIASLHPFPANAFAHDAARLIESARWRSRSGEDREAFRRRIRRDLAEAGVTGELVTIYERGGHFERNRIGAHMLIPA